MVQPITSAPTNPSHEDIIMLTGPRLLGLLFNWGLLGILTTQVYVYYLNFPKDRAFVKALVYGVYIVDWAQTCSATYDAFRWFVYGWGNIEMLYGLYTAYLNVPLFSSLIGAAVQIFFGWRIWTFSGSSAIFVLVVILALLQLGGGFAVVYFLYRDPSEVTRESGLVGAVGIRLGGSALVDTVISASMTYYLLRSKERAVGHMNNVLTQLVRLTVETGTATAVAAIIDLVFFLTEHNGLHQVSGVVLGKLYSNTLLVIFNNRLIMASKKKALEQSGSDMPLSTSVGFRPRHSNTDRSVLSDTEAGTGAGIMNQGKDSKAGMSTLTGSGDWS